MNIKYTVLKGNDPAHLAWQVESHAQLGWKLAGGVAVTTEYGVVLYQAMFKELP